MKNDTAIYVLRGDEVATVLCDREHEVLNLIETTYRLSAEGGAVSPESVYLRFPGDHKSRIIAKPAFLASPYDVAGLKWVASFPSNSAIGLNRAAAVLILNSPLTGRPYALLEGSLISSARTAASAAIAAKYLHPESTPSRAGVVGCGPVNLEVIRYLKSGFPSLEAIYIYDHSQERENEFGRVCTAKWGLEVSYPGNAIGVFQQCALVSIATDAVEPHIHNLDDFRFASTLLHISLRDFSAEAILEADNVVDDSAHVCTARTSLHLAELTTGNRGFIRCNLGDILSGRQAARPTAHGVSIFSPFGMAFLDLALGKFVLEEAVRLGLGLSVEGFHCPSLLQSTSA